LDKLLITTDRRAPPPVPLSSTSLSSSRRK